MKKFLGPGSSSEFLTLSYTNMQSNNLLFLLM